MNHDKWYDLWKLATWESEGVARIEPNPEDPKSVVLVWPDGWRGAWCWHNSEWRPVEAISQAPCDVAARDSL